MSCTLVLLLILLTSPFAVMTICLVRETSIFMNLYTMCQVFLLKPFDYPRVCLIWTWTTY